MSAKTVAIALLLAALLLAALLIAGLMYTARAAEPGTPSTSSAFTIQCMMITGCWWHPTGYAADFWMWHAIYAHLNSNQYDRVWNTADWRWIPETPPHLGGSTGGAAGHAH